MTNEYNARGEFLTLAAPSAPNSSLGPISGDPMMLGAAASVGLAGVCSTSYTQPSGLVPTGQVAVALIGVFLLSVTGQSSLSPSSGVQINPGDKIYADGGTLDTTTGWLYGFTLDANSGGRYFGNVLDKVVSGQTQVVRVRLKVSGD